VRIAYPIIRIRGRLAFWAAAGVALLVSHDAIYLVQVGPGASLAAALRQAAHDYWGLASLLLALVGVGVLGATMLRLRGLHRAAAALGADAADLRSRPYLGRWIRAWVRLLAIVAGGFLVQENVEHLIGHGHSPGLGALIGPEYPLALPVIGLITAVAALVTAAFGQVERALLAVIADAVRRRLARPPRRTVRPPLRLAVVVRSPLALAAAGRAPPWLVVSGS
jgi:hypothetical protein